MPRGQVDPVMISNLSLCIPRRIHRQARVKWLQSGGPSFAAWVAMVLEDAEEELSVADLARMQGIEMELRMRSKGKS